MGWETRGGHQYLYRKRRIGGRVVSEYRGGGALAGIFQALEALDAQDAPPPIEKLSVELVALDKAIANNWREIKTLLAAALVAGGYHNHKGQWRKKRIPKP